MRRSVDDRVLGGVCGGLAARLRVGSRTVRVLAVLAIALGGMGILLYMALWVAVPAADETSSIGHRVVGDRRELQVAVSYTHLTLPTILRV